MRSSDEDDPLLSCGGMRHSLKSQTACSPIDLARAHLASCYLLHQPVQLPAPVSFPSVGRWHANSSRCFSPSPNQPVDQSLRLRLRCLPRIRCVSGQHRENSPHLHELATEPIRLALWFSTTQVICTAPPSPEVRRTVVQRARVGAVRFSS